ELERVRPAADAHAVPDREVIAAGIGAGDRGLAREIPGDGEARQRGVALDLELRVEVPEGGRGVVDAAPELPGERRAELDDGGRAHRPGVDQVHVVLAPL